MTKFRPGAGKKMPQVEVKSHRIDDEDMRG